MAAFAAITAAVDTVVFDAKHKVINDFKAFLEEKIDFDDDMKGYFEEFLNSIKKPSPPSKSKKTSKKNAEDSASTEKRKRKPSAYNMYISAKMAEIKANDPSKKGKELMKAAIEAWNAQKAEASSSQPAEEKSDSEPETKSKPTAKKNSKKQSAKKKDEEEKPVVESSTEEDSEAAENSENEEEFD